jgi:hypothetical protein
MCRVRPFACVASWVHVSYPVDARRVTYYIPQPFVQVDITLSLKLRMREKPTPPDQGKCRWR